MTGEVVATAPDWAIALQESAFGEAVRQSLWLYPAANVGHLIGLLLLVGTIVMLDLRLIGLGSGLPAANVSRLLTPFAVVGLAVMAVTGFTMFSADASHLVGNGVFLLKMSLLVLGLANAAVFRLLWRRRLAIWEIDPPVFGRLQSAASVLVWLGVLTLGRLIAYY